ncbi:MAG TPA: bifunctional [glutamine synthetase] adenylyltransferase/[glutamine synthetase]-adenylyl-L-tyrosine phosphorylase [Jiangellaceae bacterium]|nr:bifunctional [glutamine synthetase] adenylyltransferase/[glutamine synthetase]-adenylyl-L-tyrosine phosphorylase [Jiangellaceae bacterium]
MAADRVAGRSVTRAGRLVRAGFRDVATAARELERPRLTGAGLDAGLIDSFAQAPDPDRALAGLGRLVDAAPDADALVAALRDDESLRARLVAVLGLSAALSDHLVRHPDHWRMLHGLDPSDRPDATEVKASMLRAVGADPEQADPVATGAELDALRVAYRRHLLVLAALDLADGLDVAVVAAELADLAAATLEAALAVARAGVPAAARCRLAVIAMGKCGGRELNYASDVDVVFVGEAADGTEEQAALGIATELAAGVIRVCSEHTAEGTIWPVDAALRPEGRAGPLVRTLASHLAYYRTWAKTWEFQALLKARPVAGDADLGDAYVSAIRPLIWTAADRDGFVDDVRSMRRRVEQHIRPTEADRQLKLGPGGLRDVEFAVQLLQLVHGRADDSLRSGTTLTALAALTRGGYVGRADGAVLDEAYRFLRTLEHRLQLERLRRIHVLPRSEEDLWRFGRSLGMREPVRELVDTWRRHSLEVRRLHEKLFYRPLLTAVARLPGDDARLTPEAARQRLEALGYADPAGALRHLEALTGGVSRRAAIQRTLLPVMLGWFADAPEPDAGLAGFRKVSDALGETHWYLRLLRDEGAAAERMAKVLASSRYATELLLHAPEAVTMLGDDAELVPRERAPLEAEVLAGVARHDDPVTAAGVVRAMRRRELVRVATADIVGLLSAERVGEALTAIAGASLAGALEAAVRAIEAERRQPLVTTVAVVAMGRLGGHEMGYASDADVLFVHEPQDGTDEQEATDDALAVANELRRLMGLPSPEPALTLDTDLRPEGRQGPLVRTLAAYAAYYQRWGEVWERQALLRAWPLCGSRALLERFFGLADPMRWPDDGLTDAQVLEVRRIKARVESERLPRGADPSTHLKLGPGGLADVEWTVQLLQLRHAASVEGLRTTRTPRALEAAVRADLLGENDRTVLLAAWRTATAIRNAVVLVSGRASDAMPRDPRALTAVSRLLGYAPGRSTEFVDDYRKVARRARAVVERVFYGDG